MRSRTAAERVDHLRELLLDAGLADRVRVGASSPPPEARLPSSRTHRTQERKNEPTPGTEEPFSPDALLRPTSSEGRLIELGGELSSGRTALAYRLAALSSARRELVGWVDLPDALDPRYLQRAGVRLEVIPAETLSETFGAIEAVAHACGVEGRGREL
ncbi:MAG TPA: hypothetical protein VEI82_13130, partial [Myxococcota bacterium]|nr:hypothetical protein [Myxococcota bacterium]